MNKSRTGIKELEKMFDTMEDLPQSVIDKFYKKKGDVKKKNIVIAKWSLSIYGVRRQQLKKADYKAISKSVADGYCDGNIVLRMV